MTFSVSNYDPDKASNSHELEITRALIDGNNPGGNCRVRVTEGASTFEGGCTDDTPTADKPCQTSFDVKGDTITGSVYCDELSSSASLSIKRYLVHPGSSDEAAEFELQGCTGL